MKLNTFGTFWILTVIIILFSLSGCKTDSQRWEDLFVDGKVPEILLALANQQETILSHQDEIVHRTEEDRRRGDTMEVAVIDMGVDPLHPDLFHQISFRVNENRVLGVGMDFQSDDQWATPDLVNVDLFAFGAKKIQDGKIDTPLKNPIELIDRYNQQFMDLFLSRLRQDDALKTSLFSKMTTSNTSLYGLYQLFEVLSPTKFNIETYNENKKLNRLYSPNLRSKWKTNKWDERKIKQVFHPVDVHFIVDSDWTLFSEVKSFGSVGLPYLRKGWLELIHQLEHADRFFILWEKTFADFKNQTTFLKDFDQLVEFAKSQKHKPSDSRREIESNIIVELSDALWYSKYGAKMKDPYRELSRDLYSFYVYEHLKDKTSSPPLIVTSEDIVSSFESFFNEYKKYIDYLSKVPFLLYEEKEKISAYQLQFIALEKMFVSFKNEYTKVKSVLLKPWDPGPESLLKMRNETWTYHPFLLSSSSNQSHGNHVSKIIINNSPRLRIHPIRIALGSHHTSLKRTELEYAVHSELFMQWLKIPLIFRAITQEYSFLFNGKNFENTEAGRAEFATAFMQLFYKTIRTYLEQNPTHTISNREVEKAINYVNLQQIPVANCSFGDNFEIPVDDSEDSKDDILKKLHQTLLYEYFKYTIGKAVQGASKTIFVVSTGNDGKWLDSQSHSAIPVDLYSTLLAKHENPDLNEIAPNNHLTNILGVGSLNKNGNLSSYTNVGLSLWRKMNIIYAQGENVLSSVRPQDFSFTDSVLKKTIPQLFEGLPLSVNDDRVKPFFLSENEKNNLSKKGYTFNEIETIIQDRKDIISSFQYRLSALVAYEKTLLNLEYPAYRGMMSGTSMSAPEVAKHLSQQILKNADLKGLSPFQYISSSDYSTQKEIEELVENGNYLGIHADKYFKRTPEREEITKNQNMNAILIRMDELKK